MLVFIDNFRIRACLFLALTEIIKFELLAQTFPKLSNLYKYTIVLCLYCDILIIKYTYV